MKKITFFCIVASVILCGCETLEQNRKTLQDDIDFVFNHVEEQGFEKVDLGLTGLYQGSINGKGCSFVVGSSQLETLLLTRSMRFYDFNLAKKLKSKPLLQGYEETPEFLKDTYLARANLMQLGNVRFDEQRLFAQQLAMPQEFGVGLPRCYLGVRFLNETAAILNFVDDSLYLSKQGKAGDLLGPPLRTFGYQEIHLVKDREGFYYVPIELKEKSFHAALDVGAENSLINRTFLNDIKAGKAAGAFEIEDIVGDPRRIGKVNVRGLQIGGYAVPSASYGVYDHKAAVQQWNLFPKTEAKLEIVLGRDFLRRAQAIVDFGQQKLYLLDIATYDK